MADNVAQMSFNDYQKLKVAPMTTLKILTSSGLAHFYTLKSGAKCEISPVTETDGTGLNRIVAYKLDAEVTIFQNNLVDMQPTIALLPTATDVNFIFAAPTNQACRGNFELSIDTATVRHFKVSHRLDFSGLFPQLIIKIEALTSADLFSNTILT